MGNHAGWISLDSCINDYLTESEQSNNKYFKLFHSAFRCFELLGLDFFYQVKSIMPTINANGTITLPADFINYTKFGILNGMGEIVPLKYNENLTTLSDTSSSRIANIDSTNLVNFYSYSSPVFFNFWDGSSYNNLYGVPANAQYQGGFKIDYENGVIILDPNFLWQQVVLEYTASPVEGQEYYIPVQFRETIISWLAWKDIINMPASRKGNLGDKRDRRHEYFEARRLGIRAYRPFYLDQAYIQNVEAQRLCVKV